MLRSIGLTLTFLAFTCSPSFPSTPYDPVTATIPGAASDCKTRDLRASAGVRGETLHGIDTTFEELLTIDTATAATQVVGMVGSPNIAGMARDPSSGAVYGIDSGTGEILTIDLATGITVVVGNTGLKYPHSLAIDPATGLMYAVDNSSSLYTVDRTTGAATFVGALGFDNIIALDFDPTTGVLYGGYAYTDTSGLLITIDTATGQGTWVADTYRICGMCFAENGDLFAVDNGLSNIVDSSLYSIDKNTGAYREIGSLGVNNVLGIIFEPEDLGLDIRCNGGDQGVMVPRRTNVKIDFSLTAGPAFGQPADLWIIIVSPLGKFCYDGTGPVSGWHLGAGHAFHTGPITDWKATVLDRTLPPNTYKAIIGLDSAPNGILDLGSVMVRDRVGFLVF